MTGGISVVVTVRDDREELDELLGILCAQTRPPDEIVVVDGGSRDGTVELLRGWSERDPRVRVHEHPGANISEGRNHAIRAARHEWIACTDAGCRPTPGWLEAIDRARADADFIAGPYAVGDDSPFERALAVSLYPSVGELASPGPLVRLSHRLFGRGFTAIDGSGRSMAFTKEAWRAVGGFPEGIYAGEDVAFSTAVVNAGFAAKVVPGAVVGWRPRPTWSANARMYRTYGRGGIRTKNAVRHSARAAGWLLGAALVAVGGFWGVAVAAAGGLAYLGLPMRRAAAEGLAVRHWWRIPAAAAMKDMSLMAGALTGLRDLAGGRGQPRAERPGAQSARAA